MNYLSSRKITKTQFVKYLDDNPPEGASCKRYGMKLRRSAPEEFDKLYLEWARNN